MKKKADTEKHVIKTETIKQVVQEELDIIREVYADGSVVYRHENDDGEGFFSPIDTYNENLYDVIRRPLEKIEALANLLGDDYWSEIGFILESIINETKQQYEELFDHLDRELGSILVDTVRRGQVSYRTGRIAGIRIKQLKDAEEQAA